MALLCAKGYFGKVFCIVDNNTGNIGYNDHDYYEFTVITNEFNATFCLQYINVHGFNDMTVITNIFQQSFRVFYNRVWLWFFFSVNLLTTFVFFYYVIFSHSLWWTRAFPQPTTSTHTSTHACSHTHALLRTSSMHFFWNNPWLFFSDPPSSRIRRDFTLNDQPAQC